jgi:hypothetical protein
VVPHQRRDPKGGGIHTSNKIPGPDDYPELVTFSMRLNNLIGDPGDLRLINTETSISSQSLPGYLE